MEYEMDKDLRSLQIVRDLVKKAKIAQKMFREYDQIHVDFIVDELAKAAEKNSVKLAEMAVSETGYGNVKDKTTKNVFASRILHEYIKNMKTIGVIHEDEQHGIVEIGVPFGVIAGLVPSTNPTSTAIYKALISLKAGNAIIFSPHPAALCCIMEVVDILRETLKKNGFPEDLISCISVPTMEATDALMKHQDVSLILATGGSAVVRAAYSSGTPALGVGPGNVPAFIEKTADIKMAVSRIIAGKIFDNGVICASEQAVVVEREIYKEVKKEFINQGCYFVNEEEKLKMEKIIDTPYGSLNAKIVGKTASQLADMAKIEVPENTKIIIAEETGVGKGYPFSREKLSPILAFYVEDDWKKGCDKCIELLDYGGMGHTLGIHSNDKDIIMEFALRKPASRIIVNSPTTHGAIGATTNLAPALTLGCGAVGGSATSDNVSPMNLINIRRLAYGKSEAEDLKPRELVNSSCQTQNISQINDTEKLVKTVVDLLMKQLSH